MTKLDVQYDILNKTPASASPVDANFNRIEQHTNQEVIERDGTVAMRAQLKLVGDPEAPLDAAPKQYVDAVLPVGIIMMFGGAAAPPGGRWALCNGAEVETATYPALFAVIGSAYGGSAGRFNLPNLIDRFPRGAVPGTTGGSADQQVPVHSHQMDHNHPAANTGVESAAHTHLLNIQSGGPNVAHQHWHGIGNIVIPGGPYKYQIRTVGDWPEQANLQQIDITTTPTNVDGPAHSHNVTGATGGQDVNHFHGVAIPTMSGRTSNEGVAVANANLPPYVGVSYIIRVN